MTKEEATEKLSGLQIVMDQKISDEIANIMSGEQTLDRARKALKRLMM